MDEAAPGEGDPFLRQFVAWAETIGMSLPLTLVTDGGVIQGTLTSSVAYLDAVSQAFKGGVADPNLAQTWAELFRSAGTIVRGDLDGEPDNFFWEWIHLHSAPYLRWRCVAPTRMVAWAARQRRRMESWV